jgi:hypothetical protein
LENFKKIGGGPQVRAVRTISAAEEDGGYPPAG